MEAKGAEILVFVFAKDGEEWRLESRNEINDFAGMEVVDKMGFQYTGSGKPGVLIASHEMGGKCESYHVNAVMLGDGGNRVFPIEIDDDCDFDYGNEFSEFKARFDAKSSSDDIVVSYRNQNKPRNRRWRLQDGEYKEVKVARRGGKKRK